MFYLPSTVSGVVVSLLGGKVNGLFGMFSWYPDVVTNGEIVVAVVGVLVGNVKGFSGTLYSYPVLSSGYEYVTIVVVIVVAWGFRLCARCSIEIEMNLKW